MSIRTIEVEAPEEVEIATQSGHKIKGAPKAFTGNGANEIEVPPLRAVHALFIDGQNIGLSEKREVPVDTTLVNFQSIDMAVITVEKSGDKFVVRRSPFSNDGIWQLGAKIEIWADWIEGKATTPKSAPPATPPATPPANDKGAEEKEDK